MRKLGKGNRPQRSDTLTDTDITAMYESGVLGRESPDALLHTLWRDNMLFMGMRANTEHQQLRWGDIVLKQDPDSNNLEYLEMNTERGTKTRSGEDPRNIREVPARAWSLPDNPERCPVTTYKFYRDRRPKKFMAPDSPYYLAVLKKQPRLNTDWFKCQPVGKNKIASFMKIMVENTSAIDNNRKLTNTSVRKHLVAKLNDAFVPKDIARHITGHKNVKSLDSYDAISKKQQLKVSGILAGTNKNQIDSMQPIEDSSIKQVPTAALVQQFASTQSTLSTVTQPSAIHPGGFCIQATSASQFTSTQSTLSDAIPQSSHNLHPGGFLMQTTTSALQSTTSTMMNPTIHPPSVFMNAQPSMMLMNNPSNQMMMYSYPRIMMPPHMTMMPVQPHTFMPTHPHVIMPVHPHEIMQFQSHPMQSHPIQAHPMQAHPMMSMQPQVIMPSAPETMANTSSATSEAKRIKRHISEESD